MNSVRNPNDLLYGATLIIIGLVGLWLGRHLQVGSTLRMGPGWMPDALCFLLLMLGSLIGVRSFFVEPMRLAAWAPMPLIFVIGAIAFFAGAVERLGLPIAVAGLVLISSLGDRESRRLETVILAVGLAVLSSLLFVKLLGLPIALWPEIF